jgi:hypothetical protein
MAAIFDTFIRLRREAPPPTTAPTADERIGIRDLYAGRDFLHSLVKALASGG